MKSFKLVVYDANGSREFSNVTSFVGEDGSGSFGILAGHARMITSLVVGLARFRIGEDAWLYLAMPGGILYYRDDVLRLSTRRCLVGDDYTRISTELREQLLAEELKTQAMKESVRRMATEIFKRLWEMTREGR
jgi:F-type H+-transporting ATPase subunit epsilon